MIRFPTVVASEGNGFNSDTGLFTAPINGIYSFTISALSNDDSSIEWFDMVHNEQRVCRAYTSNAHHTNLGCTVNLKLAKNDRVYMKHGAGAIRTDEYTTFTG